MSNLEEEKSTREILLKELKSDPGNCNLFDKLVDQLISKTDAAKDYGMATHRLLIANHAPRCHNKDHKSKMVRDWG